MKNDYRTGLTRQAKATAAALTLAMMSFGVGCGDDTEELEVPDTCSQELQLCEANVFLSVEEFEFLRQEDAVTILDVRSDENDFSAGHVPGATFVQFGLFRDGDNYNILYEDDNLLQDKVRDLGVNNDDTIVVYGEGDGSGSDSIAGNVYWTLEYLGHDNVYLLDGGLNAWINAGYGGLDTGNDGPAETGDFTVERREEVFAGFEDVHAAIDNGDWQLIDTRHDEEWYGEDDRNGNNPQVGHIPNAVHYHWEDIFTDDGTLRPRDELLAEFEQVGIDVDEPAIAYCQSGVRSGYFYAVLKWLGTPEVQNYDGSWLEWAHEADEADVILPDPSSE